MSDLGIPKLDVQNMSYCVTEYTCWEWLLTHAVERYIVNNATGIDRTHIADTPNRVVKAFTEHVSGYKIDPAKFLETRFATTKYDQMVHIAGIKIVSTCAHHLERIIGVCRFAYIPNAHVVGLSKIPRMIRALSKRLQVQEQLTQQIATTFYDTVQPLGCGVHIRARHLCMESRGVQEHAAVTETTALLGNFRSPGTRQEFLMSIDRTANV